MNHRQAVRFPKARMITLEELRSRGWSRREVEDWLGEPDRWAPEPLWAAHRVQSAECSRQEWAQAPTDARVRNSSGRAPRFARSAAARRRRARELTCLHAEVSPLEIDQLEHQVVLELARWRWLMEVGTPFPEEESARLAVNLLRHLHSDYEVLMREIDGRPGARRAYAIAWERLVAQARARFPELAQEFERQRDARPAALSGGRAA